jgi:hypothetical protein
MTRSSRITRLNARVPEDDARKLAYLSKSKGIRTCRWKDRLPFENLLSLE